VSVAKLLDNPTSPTFAEDLAKVLNLMIATRANLSEIGRALSYAGWMQRRANLSPEERKAQMVEAIARANQAAEDALGLSGNMNPAERELVNVYNKAMRDYVDASMDAAEADERLPQLAADTVVLHDKLKAARKARDEAKGRERAAKSELNRLEKLAEEARGKTPPQQVVDSLVANAKRAADELDAARAHLRDAKAKVNDANRRTAEAKEKLAKVKAETKSPSEISKAEGLARKAEADLDQARDLQRQREQAIKDAEDRAKAAKERADKARQNTPTPADIQKARQDARAAERAADKAFAEKQAAYKELQAARQRIKDAIDRAAKAQSQTQAAKTRLAMLKKPQFIGKGGVSMDEIVAYLGGKKGLDRMQKAIAIYGKNNDPAHTARFLQGLATNIHKTKAERAKRGGAWGAVHRAMSMWLEQFRAFILTGIMTHGVNLLSNAVFGSVEQLLTRPIAEALPGGRGAINHYREFGKALARTVADIYPALRFGMTEEFPAAHFEAFLRMRPEMQDEAMNLGGNKWMDSHGGVLPGSYGKWVRTVGFSPLGAADLVFKLLPYRMSVNLQKQNGGVVDYGKAIAAAEYQTFQTQLSEGMAKISTGINHFPLIGFIIPFFKTLVNLINRTFDYTPVISQMRNADNFRGDAEARNVAIAQGLVGGILAALALALHGDGDDDPESRLSGTGPTNFDKRNLWLANNEPLALEVGGYLVPLWRIEPFASAMGLAIGVSDALRAAGKDGDYETAGKLVASALTQVVVGKSFMSGVEDALSAAMNIETMGWKYVTETLPQSIVLGSAIPNFVNQAGDISDDWKREARGWKENVMKRIPIVREQLPQKTDYKGAPILEARSGTLLPVQRIPVTAKDDPVAAMLLSLDQGIQGNPKALRDMLDELGDMLMEAQPDSDPIKVSQLKSAIKAQTLRDRYQRIEEALSMQGAAEVLKKLTPEERKALDAALKTAVADPETRTTMTKAVQKAKSLGLSDLRRAYGLPDKAAQVAAYQKSIDNARLNSPDQLTTGGSYQTLVSGAIQAFGWDMFLMALPEPERMVPVFDSFFQQTLFPGLIQTCPPYG
jgi:hypothetical protein